MWYIDTPHMRDRDICVGVDEWGEWVWGEWVGLEMNGWTKEPVDPNFSKKKTAKKSVVAFVDASVYHENTILIYL